MSTFFEYSLQDTFMLHSFTSPIIKKSSYKKRFQSISLIYSQKEATFKINIQINLTDFF